MANKLIAKQWHNATIQNNFVFGKTMELYPDLCRRLLEMILEIKIKGISYPEREKTIETRFDSKGIRLDVYVEERGANRYFDVEMQIADSDNIAKPVATKTLPLRSTTVPKKFSSTPKAIAQVLQLICARSLIMLTLALSRAISLRNWTTPLTLLSSTRK